MDSKELLMSMGEKFINVSVILLPLKVTKANIAYLLMTNFQGKPILNVIDGQSFE